MEKREPVGIGRVTYEFYIYEDEDQQELISECMEAVESVYCNPCMEGTCRMVGGSGQYLTREEFDAERDAFDAA